MRRKRKKNDIRGTRGGSSALAVDERGGTKSQTGREISCQPQRHRQEEEEGGGRWEEGVAKATAWGKVVVGAEGFES